MRRTVRTFQPYNFTLARKPRNYMTLFSLSFFFYFFFLSFSFFLSIFPLSPARLNSLSGVFFFPAVQGSKHPGAEALIVGLTHDRPGQGRGGGSGCGGTPGAAPLGFSSSQEPFLQRLGAGGVFIVLCSVVCFFIFFLPRGGDYFPVVSSRRSLLRVLRRGRRQREGAPPHNPTPNPPCPAAAPLFACHVYNLVETKTDIVVGRR